MFYILETVSYGILLLGKVLKRSIHVKAEVLFLQGMGNVLEMDGTLN